MKDFNLGRPTRIALHEPPAHAPNAALMIDFDNVTMGIRSDLQNQLRRLLNSEIIKGKVAVQRAYADWRRYPQYIVPLSEASIDLIFAPAFGSNKKNATDIRLAIDALELVFTRPEIGTFILLSGDSDFSSLVLKLKEYGKYIIGVGIRESSSDLLIQNCDEYYSYTEVTGLTKEGDLEGARRNPWELVVEAVSQMKREDDVMRSDRLKQVMQTIDSNFDEKDAGFSRFSKFVVEAGRRGLLSLEKMENGQYAIDVGADANVPPEEEAELRRAQPAQEAAAKTRRRRPRRREPDADRGLTLAAAFDLMRRTLAELGDAHELGAAAEDVYARMIEVHGDPEEPMFERPRFQRLLRQAHDAHIIELAKVDDTYRLKPGAEVERKESKEPDQPAARRGTVAREPSADGDATPEPQSG
ncbi:MAG: NYN domain-containing protein, partial [Gemmatimonadales bacterium]|nr:NYN domain-containing protein [Gemmatimonadales bacterium]